MKALRTNSGRLVVVVFLALLLVGAMLLSLRFGSLKLSFGEILETLFQRRDGIDYQIVFNIRLPRVLLGAMVGASLAVAGTILQGVMRNPLASPGIIGVSVYLLAWRRGVNPVRLILAGVAVSSMLGAFSSTILLLNAEQAGGVLDFTIGSLATRSWPQIRQAGPYMAAGLAAALFLSRRLNILALGDEVAAGLGIRVERTRLLLLTSAALLAASAVSVAGLLGFVGLIAPHIVRIVIGTDNRFLVPGSALFGAAMVVGCDTAGRMVMEPSELPAGVIMSLLGPPFFLWLLRRHSYEA